jgi:signal transduction histidine kinase
VNIHVSKKKGQAIWSIKDEGNGIEPHALEHVFDRFYRADSSRTKNITDGHGLGLSIAKMIADVHDGIITLKSQAGQGTTVIVVFPVAQ